MRWPRRVHGGAIVLARRVGVGAMRLRHRYTTRSGTEAECFDAAAHRGSGDMTTRIAGAQAHLPAG